MSLDFAARTFSILSKAFSGELKNPHAQDPHHARHTAATFAF
jgi:hypothetical protein